MDDLISRQAASEYLRRIIDVTDTNYRYNLGFIDGLEFCISHLSTMPSVQLEQKKGKWMMNGGMGTICSNCYSKLETTGLLSNCPNCGARMEGEE